MVFKLGHAAFKIPDWIIITIDASLKSYKFDKYKNCVTLHAIPTSEWLRFYFIQAKTFINVNHLDEETTLTSGSNIQLILHHLGQQLISILTYVECYNKWTYAHNNTTEKRIVKIDNRRKKSERFHILSAEIIEIETNKLLVNAVQYLNSCFFFSPPIDYISLNALPW